MKSHVVLVGILACLLAQAGSKPSEGAQSGKSATAAAQTLTGCIDEQKGQYVLLDDRMVKITSLQSAGSEKEVFAKYVGRKVQVSGTTSAEPKGVFIVDKIEQISASCGPGK